MDLVGGMDKIWPQLRFGLEIVSLPIELEVIGFDPHSCFQIVRSTGVCTASLIKFAIPTPVQQPQHFNTPLCLIFNEFYIQV